MRVPGTAGLLRVVLVALFAGQVACAGETGARTDLFTVALYDVGEGPGTGASPHTLIYIPFGPEPRQDFGDGCFLYVWDFAGEASRYTVTPAPSYVLSHQETQGTNTYAQYLGNDLAGPPPFNCLNELTSEFDAGERFFLNGPVARAVDPDRTPADFSVVSEDYAASGTYTFGAWGNPPEGAYYLYDFEINRNLLPAPLVVFDPGP